MPFSIIAGDSVPTTEKGMYIIFIAMLLHTHTFWTVLILDSFCMQKYAIGWSRYLFRSLQFKICVHLLCMYYVLFFIFSLVAASYIHLSVSRSDVFACLGYSIVVA